MKTITMDYPEYLDDLKTKERKGYRDGTWVFLNIMRAKNKGVHESEIVTMILDLELADVDTNALFKLFNVQPKLN